MRDVDPRATVVSALMELAAPSSLAKIAKTANLPVQNVDYWLQKLIGEGVVLCDESGEQRVYLLQPLFYDPSFATQLDKVLTELYTMTQKKLRVPSDKKSGDVAFNVLLTILHTILHEE